MIETFELIKDWHSKVNPFESWFRNVKNPLGLIPRIRDPRYRPIRSDNSIMVQEISGGISIQRSNSSLCIPILQLYHILQHQHVPFCILLGLFLSPYNWKVSFSDWPVTLNPIGSLVGFIFSSRVNQKIKSIIFVKK